MNGGAITPEFLWLALLGIYLCKESNRRGLHALDWFSLPPSMNLIVAIFICDAGVSVRSAIVWWWRMRGGGAGDFTPFESGVLIFGAALIVLGTLCKIRAMTEPDHGGIPWLLAAASTSVAIGVLLIMR